MPFNALLINFNHYSMKQNISEYKINPKTRLKNNPKPELKFVVLINLAPTYNTEQVL